MLTNLVLLPSVVEVLEIIDEEDDVDIDELFVDVGNPGSRG